jgi:radical SAM superfamily enzyme YgiQ (UPF0313 family)
MPGLRHRLLLLNPPAPQPVFRDCYCSGISKGPFFIQPLDLQIQSGFFPQADFQLEFIDAVFEKLKPSAALKRISAFKPDSILSLVGHAFFDSDATFLRQVRAALPSARIYLSGDIARFTPDAVFDRLAGINGLLTDFGTPDLLACIRGEGSAGVLTKNRIKTPDGVNLQRFSHPLPQSEVISRYAYRLPFFKSPRFYSIATSFGCPFGCLYCNTHLLGYRTRPVDQIVEELHFAWQQGFKSLYVRDATFLYDKERTVKLFREWKRTGLQFQWICFTRPDLIDEDVAEYAAGLGCCMMMVGVESYDENCLKTVSRNIRLSDIINAFKTLRKFGIRSAAQVIVGLHDTGQHCPEKLLDYRKMLEDFLKEIDPDYVSLNIYQPRPGVPTAHRLLAQLETDIERHQALAEHINRRFYFQAGAFFRQLTTIRSVQQIALQAKIAAGIFLNRS